MTRASAAKPRAARGARDPLSRYKRMRDFGRTPEPSGGRPKKARFPSFVVQKHAATRLHYDFRLEVDGVLASWAVPKGPSFDPAVKRLAMRTEDHPMDYAGFEGNIPKGQYGGGSVIVWDRGFYLNVTTKAGRLVPMARAIADGRVKIWMEGEKLKGGFALTRIGAERGKEAWLLVKHRDKEARPGRDPVSRAPRSVLSGRTVEEVAASGAVKKF